MPAPSSVSGRRRAISSLDSVFKPRGIAIVGASNDPAKPGHAVLRNLLAAGFPSHIAVVHPQESKVLGIPAYVDLDSIPGPVELLVLAVPARTTPEMVEAIARRARQRQDLRAVVAIGGGFSESGTDDGRAWQEQLAEGCRAAGVRLIGPNCLGLIDHRARLDTTFLTGLHRRAGGISLLSQSGAMGAWMALEWSARPLPVGLNKFISLGNMADVQMFEMMDFLAHDPSTRVIGLYVEGVPDGRTLVEMAGAAASRKPVVALKVGRTESGGAAASSHTGALAGADGIYDGAFRQHGIIRVERVDDFIATLSAFDKLPLPLGRRVALLTNAGGPGVYAMDTLAHSGLAMGRFSPATTTTLSATLPAMAVVGHPPGYVDMTGGVTPHQVAQAVATALRDPGIDAVVHLFIPTAFCSADDMARSLLPLLAGVRRNSLDKPLLPILLAGGEVSGARRVLEENGMLTFGSPDAAAVALSALIQYGERGRPSAAPAPTSGADGRDGQHAAPAPASGADGRGRP